MTSTIGSTSSAQPIAGVAAIVGAPSTEGAGVQDGDAVSTFGALMGSLGQGPMGGQKFPTQSHGEPQKEAQDDGPQAAAPQMLQGAQNAVSQAMWPEAMVPVAQPQLALEAPEAVATPAGDGDDIGKLSEAADTAQAIGAPRASQATLQAPLLSPTQGAQDGSGAVLQGELPKVANTDALIAAQDTTAASKSATATDNDTNSDDIATEPKRPEEDVYRMMEWQRLAYGASFAPMHRHGEAAPAAAQEDGAQPQQSSGGAPDQLSAAQAEVSSAAPALQQSQRSAEDFDSTLQQQATLSDDDTDVDALGPRATVPRSDGDDERADEAESPVKQPFFPVHMMPTVQATLAQPTQAEPQSQDSESPLSGQDHNFALSSHAQAQVAERQRPTGAPTGDVESAAAGVDTEAGKATGADQAFHQALQGALPNSNASVSGAQEPQMIPQVAPPVHSVAVSEELSRAIGQGASRVQMRIVPEGLGELDIKVQMTGQNVHLTIRGDAPELAQLLSQKVQELRQDLGQQGLSLEAMDFGTLASGNSSSGFAQDDRSRSSASRDSNDLGDGLQRLAGGASRQPISAPSRPNSTGPRDRIIDVIL